MPHGADPSAAGKALAFQRADRAGFLRFGGHTYDLPGRDPAVGGPYVAVISGPRPDQHPEPLHAAADCRRCRRQAPRRSRSLATGSPTWRSGGAATCCARGGSPTPPPRRRQGDRVGPESQPSSAIRASTARSVFYTVSKRHRNSIKRHNLKSGKEGTVVRSRAAQLLNPSAQGKHLLYVRVSRGSEPPLAIHPRRLRPDADDQATGPPRGRPQDLLARRRGTLWTTALAGGTPSSPCSGKVARRSSRPSAESGVEPSYGRREDLRRDVPDADRAVERRAGLRHQPPPARAIEVDQVVLDRGLPVVGELGHGGCDDPGAAARRSSPRRRGPRGRPRRPGIPAGRGSRSTRTASPRTSRDRAGSSTASRALPGRRAGRRGRRRAHRALPRRRERRPRPGAATGSSRATLDWATAAWTSRRVESFDGLRAGGGRDGGRRGGGRRWGGGVVRRSAAPVATALIAREEKHAASRRARRRATGPAEIQPILLTRAL